MTGPTTTAPTAPGAPHDDARPHVGHAVASEWTKLTSVRSTMWTLGALVVIVVGIGLLFVSQTADEDYVAMPFTTPALFGLLVGQLAVIVLGVLTITSEHGTGLVRTTFTAAPDRHRVLTAKYLVFSATALAATIGSVFVVAAAAMAVHHGPGAGPHTFGEWSGALVGCFYVTLLGVLALAVGALVRHSAGAITLMLGLVTLPPVIGGMLSYWEASARIGEIVLQYNVPVAMMQLFGMPTGEGTKVPGDLPQMLLLLLVTVAAVAASYVIVDRRDV
ncbi:ABC transporter permease [Streptomyces sp. NPDC002039]|uniref:ABC transporter permease n=1 Tax=unclassified Streptomyces TaxID=2593676 RepID=UPI0033194E3D